MRPLTELGDIRIIKDLGRINGLGGTFATPAEIGLGISSLALIGIGALLEDKLSVILISVGASLAAVTIASVAIGNPRP